MFCYKCGKQIGEDSSFCPYCGTRTVSGGDDQYRESLPIAGEDSSEEEPENEKEGNFLSRLYDSIEAKDICLLILIALLAGGCFATYHVMDIRTRQLEEENTSLKTKIDKLHEAVYDLDKKVKDLSKDVSDTQAASDALENRMNDVESDAKDMKDRQDQQETRQDKAEQRQTIDELLLW